MVDQIVGRIRRDTSEKIPEIEKLKEDVSNFFKIPPFNVLSCVNYISEDLRTFEIDRLSYKIIDRAVTISKDFFEREKRNNKK